MRPICDRFTFLASHFAARRAYVIQHFPSRVSVDYISLVVLPLTNKETVDNLDFGFEVFGAVEYLGHDADLAPIAVSRQDPDRDVHSSVRVYRGHDCAARLTFARCNRGCWLGSSR